jgi:hypothetical protein
MAGLMARSAFRPTRSILLHGLRLVVTRPGALLWAYAFNLGIALLFSLRLHAQFASILDHSLEAERLNSAFDLGVLAEAFQRFTYKAPSTGQTSYLGMPVYLLCYFILVPGALVCFRTGASSRLSVLAGQGIAYFWRFVRITLVTVLVSAIVLGPLSALQTKWSSYVDDHWVGLQAALLDWAATLVLLLVAALLRLYFDLVEVYVVQAGERAAAPSRSVLSALRPALRTLRANFGRAYLTFVLLTLLGFVALALTVRVAAHTLAQPRVWPAFLLLQAGLFATLATRLWQRGAETILAEDFPIPVPVNPDAPAAYTHFPADPQPAAPSLPEPDPGVFHHESPPPPPPDPLT